MQESPAKLRTPLAFGFCYISSLGFQVVPCCSDQGADLEQHVWGLDKYMTYDVSELSDLFPLTLLQDLFLHLLVGSGTKWPHFT